MELKSCYIENFGKLSHFSYIFRDGLNVIEEENGWGKSTFAAFIKAMLFGMEYTTARKYLVDRTRYIPWQGGTFGGNLTFEIQNKLYRVERTFGKKLSEDTFVLYDLSTNAESNDFSEDLGEEIWKIDRDSYEKSAFVTLSESGLLNDIISGRLGNIEEQEADMEASSNAIALIEEEMKILKSNRKTSGLLNKKKSEIQALNEELTNCNASLQLLTQYEQWLQVEKDNLAKVEAETQEVDKEQSRFIQYQKKKQLIEIMNELKDIKEIYDEEKKFFENSIHVDEEIVLLSKKIKLYEEWKSKSYLQAPYTEEECEKMQILEYKYDGIISHGHQIDEYITSYTKEPELDAKEQALENKLEHLEREYFAFTNNKKNKPRFSILGILGILLMIGGVVLVALSIIEGIFGVIPGIAALVAGVIFITIQMSLISKKKKIMEKTNQEYVKMKERLEREVENVSDKRKALQQGYQSFLTDIGAMGCVNPMQELLNVKAEFELYQQLKASIKAAKMKYEAQVKKIESEMKSAKSDVDEILALYYTELPIDMNEALDMIKSKRIFLKEKVKQYNIAKDRYNKFKGENDVELLSELSIPDQSEEELSNMCLEKKKELADSKVEINKKIASYIHDMNSAQVEVDKTVDVETGIDKINAEIEDIEVKHKLLSLTKRCMESAKECLAEKYMEEMSSAFRKYLTMLGSQEADLFSIDTHLNVKVEHGGIRHDGNRLSTGKKDLIQICMRMALVDAIYKEVEAPILIMDDPFVNLDEVSVGKGIDLLNKIAQEYQVVYFVCHGSRV